MAGGSAENWNSTIKIHSGRTGRLRPDEMSRRPVGPAGIRSDARARPRLDLNPARVPGDRQILDFLQRDFLQLLSAGFLGFLGSHIVLLSNFGSDRF